MHCIHIHILFKFSSIAFVFIAESFLFISIDLFLLESIPCLCSVHVIFISCLMELVHVDVLVAPVQKSYRI